MYIKLHATLPLVPHFIAFLGVQLQIELYTQALLALMTINKSQCMQLLTGVVILHSNVDFVLLPFHMIFLLFPEELYELTNSF